MQRPVKLQKQKVATRFFTYLVIKATDKVYLRKRSGSGIWRNLYDFPCIESEQALPVEEALTSDLFAQLIGEQPFTVSKTSPSFTHKLTHLTIVAQFIEIKLSQELPPIETKDIFLVAEKDLGKHPIPRLIELYLNT